MADDFQLFTSIRCDWSLTTVPAIHPGDLGWNSRLPSPLYMLTLHRDRMLRAASHWKWTEAVEAIEGTDGLDRLDHFVRSTLAGRLGERWGPDCEPMRVKILLSSEGVLALEHSPVPPTPLANLFPDRLPAPNDSSSSDDNPQTPLGPLRLTGPYDVYIDTDTTSPSAFTHFKTTTRGMYDDARRRAGLRPTDTTKEVLIVNRATGVVMEGSLTTPYFWRDGAWATPRVSMRPLDAQEGAGVGGGGGGGGQDGTTRRWALDRGLVVERDVAAADVVDGEAVWLSNGVRGFVFGRIRRPV